MTQFIELSDDLIVNIGTITTIRPYKDGSMFFTVDCTQAGQSHVCQETPDEILAKIAKAQANDPIERIAVALEKIVKNTDRLGDIANEINHKLLYKDS